MKLRVIIDFDYSDDRILTYLLNEKYPITPVQKRRLKRINKCFIADEVQSVKVNKRTAISKMIKTVTLELHK